MCVSVIAGVFFYYIQYTFNSPYMLNYKQSIFHNFSGFIQHLKTVGME